MKEYLEAGEFVTTHGIQGELKLYPWCDGPAFIAKLPRLFLGANGEKPVKIVGAREHKGMCLLLLDGVTLVEQARGYIGKTVYFARKDAKLPKGRYFVDDLLGATVKNADTDVVYGNIIDISHPAAHDIYTIKDAKGETHLFPAVPEFLGEILPQEGIVTVRPIEGMFTNKGKNDDED